MDPETGRFINADDTSVLQAGQEHLMGHNLYAHCLNNWINLKDEDEKLPKWAVKALIGVAVIGAATGAIEHRIKTGSWKGAGKAALESGASGFLSGAIAGAITGGIGGYAKYKDFGIDKVGKLASKNHKSNTLGVKYHFNRLKSQNKRVVNSFELHRPHANKHNVWHWQLNK